MVTAAAILKLRLYPSAVPRQVVPPCALKLILGVVALGCASEPTAIIDSLTITADVRMIIAKPTHFQTDVSVVNSSADVLRIVRNCGSHLRLMTLTDSLGPPAWTSSAESMECGTPAIEYLSPGGKLGYRYDVRAADVLAASTPSGTYRVEAVVQINGRTLFVNAGRIVLSG